MHALQSGACERFELSMMKAKSLQRNDGRGYLFRAALAGTTRPADRLNNSFSGELKEEEDMVSGKERTRLFTLPVPNPRMSNV